ncbi:MAG: hypothetical protein ACYTGW_05665 [Planctomycetota bacterium]|jgi:hypothetical protein
MATPPIALIFGILAIRQVGAKRLAILAVVLSTAETLSLVLLFLTGR